MALDPNILLGLLRGKGYSAAASAGIAGNLQTESKFDPAATGDGGTSYGLAQWHNDRRQGLFDFAQGQGAAPNDPGVQVGFLDKELHSPQYASVLSALQSAQSPEDAAKAFLGFERPAGYSDANPMGAMAAQQRIDNATRLYGGLGGIGGVAAPSPAAGGAPVAPGAIAAAAAPVADEPPPLMQPQALPGVDAGGAAQPSPLSLLPLSDLVQPRRQAGGGIRPIASLLGRRLA